MKCLRHTPQRNHSHNTNNYPKPTSWKREEDAMVLVVWCLLFVVCCLLLVVCCCCSSSSSCCCCCCCCCCYCCCKIHEVVVCCLVGGVKFTRFLFFVCCLPSRLIHEQSNKMCPAVTGQLIREHVIATLQRMPTGFDLRELDNLASRFAISILVE